MSRPSLKITRHDDEPPPQNVAFDVWNPFTASYEAQSSLDNGLLRVGQLAEQVRLIWVRHDPALSSLQDTPNPTENDQIEWAEFRISATARLVYETRNFDQQGWRRAINRSAAVETICNEIGYVPS